MNSEPDREQSRSGSFDPDRVLARIVAVARVALVPFVILNEVKDLASSFGNPDEGIVFAALRMTVEYGSAERRHSG